MPLERRQHNWALTVALIALLIAGLALYRIASPQPTIIPLGTTNLDALALSSTLSVTGASTLTGAVTGASTGAFTDNVSSSAEVDVGTFLNLSAATTVSVTNAVGATGLVPLGTYQPLDAAGTVGAIVTTTGMTAGDLLILANIGTQTITISDTGVMALSSNAALGPADSVTLVYSGTGWIEIGEGAN